jgi:cell fate (sporulation/competence/biofilm development) regulator YmcA (YheA/YmcA/DUF963 family)
VEFRDKMMEMNNLIQYLQMDVGAAFMTPVPSHADELAS